MSLKPGKLFSSENISTVNTGNLFQPPTKEKKIQIIVTSIEKTESEKIFTSI